MRTTIVLSIIVSASLALASPRATVTTTHDFKVAAHAVIDVDSSGGSVELTPGPAGAVHIEAERKAESEDVARRLEVVTRLEGNTVHVQFRSPGMLHNASVGFRIRAPADSRIEVRTGGGHVAANGFGGGIHVDTGGGNVAVADVRGAVELRSGGGSIAVDRVVGSVEIRTGGGSVQVQGTLHGSNHVRTGGGSIRVAIPADDKLAVDASTGAGSARNDFGLASDGERHSGRFHGRIGDGSAGSLELRTGGGSIALSRS